MKKFLILLLIIGLGAFIFSSFGEKEQVVDVTSVLSVDEKLPGTKTYYSEDLGVGFTYLPYPESEVSIVEEGNKISLKDQYIEVFQKDPNLTLAEAITQQFLEGYDSEKCFVKENEQTEQNVPEYIAAIISYPHSEEPNEPWWTNYENCPAYAEANGIRYFLMNKSAPDTYIFVDVGQYTAASDGASATVDMGNNWTQSIRIF